MPDRTTAIAAAFELSLLLAGAILWWRIGLSPQARERMSTPLLAVWGASAGEFILLAWLVCAGGFTASFVARMILNHYSLTPDEVIVVATSAGQLGVIGGIVIFQTFFARSKSPPPATKQNFVSTGLVTFLLAMPLVTVTSFAWQILLKGIGLPAEKQDLIRMFLEAKSPVVLVVMMILACVGAPIMEELVFRAGIFRFARTRLPRWGALLLPSCLFAALHNNLASFGPLVALGILFSLAYERTGRIGTSIVAHALFNLNSLVLVLAKVDL